MPPPKNPIYEILILVTPGFNALATMGFIDPFRAANYLEGRGLFQWRFVSEAGGICYASNAAGIECERLEAVEKVRADLVLVSSSWTPELHGSAKVHSALRGWARSGTTIAGLDTGAFIMAQCGLLRRRSAAVHYEHIDAFKEQYPQTKVLEDIFTFDGKFLSCCGGAAAVDFALHILKEVSGIALANAAARYIFQPNLRSGNVGQQPAGAEPLGATVPYLVKVVIKLMEDNLEEPLTIPTLCERAGFSHRQVDRLFARYIKKTPALYYRDIRLDRARGLVTQTEMSMSEISVASGFASQVHFSRAYKDRFGLPPIKDRVEGRVPFEFRAWPMYRKATRNTKGGEKS